MHFEADLRWTFKLQHLPPHIMFPNQLIKSYNRSLRQDVLNPNISFHRQFPQVTCACLGLLRINTCNVFSFVHFGRYTVLFLWLISAEATKVTKQVHRIFTWERINLQALSKGRDIRRSSCAQDRLLFSKIDSLHSIIADPIFLLGAHNQTTNWVESLSADGAFASFFLNVTFDF